MSRPPPALTVRLAALLVGLAVGAAAVALLPHDVLFRDPPGASATAGQDGEDGRKWACPMFCTMDDEPGTCPVCGMTMEPVVDMGDRVRLSARARDMIGLETSVATSGPMSHQIDAYGKIRRDERTEAQITAWVGGRLDRLYVDFTGTEVNQGDHVAEVYSPELIAAQEELLSALRALDRVADREGAGMEGLVRNLDAVVQAARRKLLLLGMPEPVVDEVVAGRAVRDHLVIYSPVEGTVVSKHVETGDYVQTGQAMFTVVDLSQVWVILEVFEKDAGAVRIGHAVDVHVPHMGPEPLRGKVAFVDPYLDERLRVAMVRVNLPNPGGRLKPGMFVDAVIHVPLTDAGLPHDPIAPGTWYCPMHPYVISAVEGETCRICDMAMLQKPGDPAAATTPGDVVTIPREAVLDLGRRTMVYVQTQAPGPLVAGTERWPAIYERREVHLGFRVGDAVVVRHGLEPGELVATHGQMLVDSQLQLTGRSSLLAPAGAGAPADPHAGH